ncbi:hypothetical protein [Halogeometricum borinquense]|uniref:hypothetical protein n=1 Tax=Halogeometricum borinquense TaxID=60847 RepID=UPI00342DD77B
MDSSGPVLDVMVAGTGFSALVLGVGVVTESIVLALGAAFFLLLALVLVYPFARFTGEAN